MKILQILMDKIARLEGVSESINSAAYVLQEAITSLKNSIQDMSLPGRDIALNPDGYPSTVPIGEFLPGGWKWSECPQAPSPEEEALRESDPYDLKDEEFLYSDSLKPVQDNRNRWAKQLGSVATYDAAKLLDIIRPEVESILITAGFTSPPSQSMRVRNCLEAMDVRLRELIERQQEVSDPKLNMRQRFELQKTVNTLKAFQAVHKTITILEGTVI